MGHKELIIEVFYVEHKVICWKENYGYNYKFGSYTSKSQLGKLNHGSLRKQEVLTDLDIAQTLLSFDWVALL